MSYHETSCLPKEFILDITVKMRFQKTVIYFCSCVDLHICCSVFLRFFTQNHPYQQYKKNTKKVGKAKKYNNQIAGNLAQGIWEKTSENSTLY